MHPSSKVTHRVKFICKLLRLLVLQLGLSSSLTRAQESNEVDFPCCIGRIGRIDRIVKSVTWWESTY